MKILLYIAIYTVANAYILYRIIGWVTALSEKLNRKAVKIVIGILYGICYLTVIVGYFLPISETQKQIQSFANQFLGAFIYMFIIAVLFDISKIVVIKLLKKDKNYLRTKKYLFASGLTSILILAFVIPYGIYTAKNITIKEYDVSINKYVESQDKLKVALIADLHMGYSVGCEMMEDMAEKINSQNVDLVVMAGDIFDNSVNTVDDLNRCKEAIKSIKSKYGIYATFGNHDIDERLFGGFSIHSKNEDFRDSKMEDFLKEAGVNLLDDEVTTILNDSIYIVGRKDSEKPGDGTGKRKQLEELLTNVDMSKPVIVLEHEPRNLEHISSLGVDAHLAGHTHDGQFFPLNIGGKIIWNNPYGYKQIGNMASVVTSGIGVYRT